MSPGLRWHVAPSLKNQAQCKEQQQLKVDTSPSQALQQQMLRSSFHGAGSVLISPARSRETGRMLSESHHLLDDSRERDKPSKAGETSQISFSEFSRFILSTDESPRLLLPATHHPHWRHRHTHFRIQML